jgi:hypothetical protein
MDAERAWRLGRVLHADPVKVAVVTRRPASGQPEFDVQPFGQSLTLPVFLPPSHVCSKKEADGAADKEGPPDRQRHRLQGGTDSPGRYTDYAGHR